MVYRYSGFFHDGEGWVALLGSTEYTRSDLLKMDAALNSPEQMEEVRKALAELPDDTTKPKRGQRRKIVPVDGDSEEGL